MLDDPPAAGQDGGMSDQGLSRLLLEAFRVLDTEVEAALEDRGSSGLSPGHASGLLLIDRGGTRLTDLAGRAGITKQAMMQVIDDLEGRGFVRRQPDANDARAKVVKLTARGLRERAEARKAITAVETRARRALGARRYEALRDALEVLTAAEA
jgi:DNA-binding MarR family transcriptional regulator